MHDIWKKSRETIGQNRHCVILSLIILLNLESERPNAFLCFCNNPLLYKLFFIPDW